MARRRGRINIVGSLITLTILAAIAGSILFGPYYWDHQLVKETARSAALKWAESTLEHKAKQKLDDEWEYREIPSYIDKAAACSFNTSGRRKIVTCAWAAHVYYPLTDYYKTIYFETTSEVTAGGKVNTY